MAIGVNTNATVANMKSFMALAGPMTHLNGKFTADRAPVTYILATNQMKAGQMVMNIDSTKHSKDELLNRY